MCTLYKSNLWHVVHHMKLSERAYFVEERCLHWETGLKTQGHPIGPAEDLQHVSKLVIYPASRFFKMVRDASPLLTAIKVSQAVGTSLSPFTGNPLRHMANQDINVPPLTVAGADANNLHDDISLSFIRHGSPRCPNLFFISWRLLNSFLQEL
jgi:hypothetical protein